MKKHFFLGLAANQKHPCLHFFTSGTKKDRQDLETYLSMRYQGEAILTKNGRSALALALKAYFNEKDQVIVNGFTCHAVIEAVKAAGLTPIYADIDPKNLNFNTRTLEDCLARANPNKLKGLIIQNTLGNPADATKILKFAKKHHLLIIEDLAHCVGTKYPNGKEAGTIGSATILSFGKEKSVDAISGGALVLRDFEHTNSARFHIPKNAKKLWTLELRPTKRPRRRDIFRERRYPLFGLACRRLTRIHLGGIYMKFLLRTHLVERSADSKLDLRRRINDTAAKIALNQLKKRPAGTAPLRDFFLLDNRDEILQKLKSAGFYFDGFWYEKPISPARYYKNTHFDEKACPVATTVSQKIINLPTYYTQKQLKPAYDIIKKYGKPWKAQK